eukprot:TRINITY_DN556_c1_g1_i6.p1 TRINITY_DN556_c1_g1~~TRINITY_DN556_c1_g1_i6.p1  ORF type:complete len:982 (-),score=237.51 TRINITY_DN556_c1_g1_i6:1544-4489(-)
MEHRKLRGIRHGWPDVAFGTMTFTRRGISSFYGMREYPEVKVLCLQKNRLINFEGISPLPSLEELDLRDNAITSLLGLRTLPAIERVWMSGNPIARHPHYQLLCISAFGPRLRYIDGVSIPLKERRKAKEMGYTFQIALRLGYLFQDLKELASVSVASPAVIKEVIQDYKDIVMHFQDKVSYSCKLFLTACLNVAMGDVKATDVKPFAKSVLSSSAHDALTETTLAPLCVGGIWNDQAAMEWVQFLEQFGRKTVWFLPNARELYLDAFDQASSSPHIITGDACRGFLQILSKFARLMIHEVENSMKIMKLLSFYVDSYGTDVIFEMASCGLIDCSLHIASVHVLDVSVTTSVLMFLSRLLKNGECNARLPAVDIIRSVLRSLSILLDSKDVVVAGLDVLANVALTPQWKRPLVGGKCFESCQEVLKPHIHDHDCVMSTVNFLMNVMKNNDYFHHRLESSGVLQCVWDAADLHRHDFSIMHGIAKFASMICPHLRIEEDLVASGIVQFLRSLLSSETLSEDDVSMCHQILSNLATTQIGTMEIVNSGVRDAVIHRFEQSREEHQQAMVKLVYSCNPALETRHVDPRDMSDLTRTLMQATPEELKEFDVDDVVGWLDRLLDIPMAKDRWGPTVTQFLWTSLRCFPDNRVVIEMCALLFRRCKLDAVVSYVVEDQNVWMELVKQLGSEEVGEIPAYPLMTVLCKIEKCVRIVERLNPISYIAKSLSIPLDLADHHSRWSLLIELFQNSDIALMVDAIPNLWERVRQFIGHEWCVEFVTVLDIMLRKFSVVLASDDVRVIWDAFAKHVEDKPRAKHILHLLDAALQKKVDVAPLCLSDELLRDVANFHARDSVFHKQFRAVVERIALQDHRKCVSVLHELLDGVKNIGAPFLVVLSLTLIRDLCEFPANVSLLCEMGVVPFSLQWMSSASDLPSIQKHAAEVLVLLSYDQNCMREIMQFPSLPYILENTATFSKQGRILRDRCSV